MSNSITSRFISVLIQGESDPYPVAVNVSTTTCVECRSEISVPSGGYGPGSNVRIPTS